MSQFFVTFTTPLFSRGVFDTPEIRPPSIRGQLHWWFRALGGRYEDEKAVFGGVHQDAAASKVVIRVSGISGETGDFKTLPHKGGGLASPKKAFAPGSSFTLHVLTRLRGFASQQQEAHFLRSLEAWLLLGTLGLRATRAAGSFTWSPGDGGFSRQVSFDSYEARCRDLLRGAPLKFALLETRYASAEDARRVVSDTLGGRDDSAGANDLARLNDPLGKIHRGRKTSPLRFRIVTLADQEHFIAAVWDDRGNVTGNRPNDLVGIVRLLQERKPALGNQLEKILDGKQTTL
jgi:CRISPR/Cas system CMR-associated protein Cmr1 (group 7 of RAMP superfamily)